MKNVFVTIVLDGMPWITRHHPEFELLKVPWEWHVVEGVAEPVHCTSWCAPIPPRLSIDGTTQYLDSLSSDPRVHLYRSPLWPGKVSMFNRVLETLTDPCLLWQIDSDEWWSASQIAVMNAMFEKYPERNCAYYLCRYFVGPGIVITSMDTYGNNRSYEWLRTWRFKPGMKFEKHEPPVLRGKGFFQKPFTHKDTMMTGAVFDHYAYSTERQVAFKELFYAGHENPNAAKYSGAVENWKRLQANTEWPVDSLDRFLPWVGPNVKANRIAL